ncbi:MAG: hypothetical protein HC827_23230 [Cyanobacteria bacterium RM1_2_2]|nr:hypothetical protein [Cyanobacteria bacterium RM1_2_2]
MQIEVQLDEEQARKLAYIQQQTQQDTMTLIDQLIGQAIDRHYQQIRASSEADLVAKMKQSTFVGCFKGTPDLATRSKEIVYDILQKKFSQSSQEP